MVQSRDGEDSGDVGSVDLLRFVIPVVDLSHHQGVLVCAYVPALLDNLQGILI